MCLYVRAGAQGPRTRACDINLCYFCGDRILVRQSSTTSAKPTPEVIVTLLDSQGTQISSQHNRASRSDLQETGWYWLQWTQASTKPVSELRLALTAQSALTAGQEVNYDSVCVAIESATQGQLSQFPSVKPIQSVYSPFSVHSSIPYMFWKSRPSTDENRLNFGATPQNLEYNHHNNTVLA